MIWSQATYNKTYKTAAAEEKANATFHANVAMIYAHNNNNPGNMTYQMGINQFTDMVI
jgi:hypothetical protein